MRRGRVSLQKQVLHVEKNKSTSQQGKLGRETLQDQSATKNGECWGLHLAAEGFVVADSYVLPVLSFVMEVMEKALILAVAMAMVVWMRGE